MAALFLVSKLTWLALCCSLWYDTETKPKLKEFCYIINPPRDRKCRTSLLLYLYSFPLNSCLVVHTLQDSELHRKIFKNVRPKLPLKFLEIKVDVTSFLISKTTLNSIPYLLVPSCKYFPEHTVSFLGNCHNLNILSKNLSNYIKCVMKFSGIHMETQKYLTTRPGVSG